MQHCPASTPSERQCRAVAQGRYSPLLGETADHRARTGALVRRLPPGRCALILAVSASERRRTSWLTSDERVVAVGKTVSSRNERQSAPARQRPAGFPRSWCSAGPSRRVRLRGDARSPHRACGRGLLRKVPRRWTATPTSCGLAQTTTGQHALADLPAAVHATTSRHCRAAMSCRMLCGGALRAPTRHTPTKWSAFVRSARDIKRL